MTDIIYLPQQNWRVIARELAQAVEYTFRLNDRGLVTCTRCGKPVEEHQPELCEVAAALKKYREALGVGP